MKYIVKKDEPKEFADWKALTNEDWQPSFSDLSGDTKKAVKRALMAEQGAICCYCEQRLTENKSHIEHFRPQSDPAVDSLEFNNLLCSCQNQLKKGEPRHCGNLKGEWFDSELLVSPLDPDCEGRFAFTGNGIIKPLADHDQAASETIARLGLSIPKLNAMRAKAIEPFLEESLSIDQMLAFFADYLNRDASGHFNVFWTTIRYLHGGFIAARMP